MKRSLKQIAEAVEGRLEGDGSVEMGGVASIGSASRQDLVFVEDEKYLARALECEAGAVIAGEFAAGKSAAGKPLIFCRHPKLAFARAAKFLRESNGLDAGVRGHDERQRQPGVQLGDRPQVAFLDRKSVV